MKEARDEFGFRSIVVFQNRLHLNASRIEDKLQGRYQALPLGCPRLWRCVGKGAKYSEKERVHEHKDIIHCNALSGSGLTVLEYRKRLDLTEYVGESTDPKPSTLNPKL